MKRKYFPILLVLEEQPCIVVGGGEVALRKVESLLTAGADITVISPELNEGLEELRKAGRINHIDRDLRPGDLAGARLVITATNDRDVQDQAWQEARKNGTLINVADMPDKCSFIVPAVVRRGDLTIAISTSGASPALSAALRRKLEQDFGPEYDLLLSIMGRLREKLLADEPDPKKRSAIFKRLAGSALPELLKRNKLEEADELIWELTGDKYRLNDLSLRKHENTVD